MKHQEPYVKMELEERGGFDDTYLMVSIMKVVGLFVCLVWVVKFEVLMIV